MISAGGGKNEGFRGTLFVRVEWSREIKVAGENGTDNLQGRSG